MVKIYSIIFFFLLTTTLAFSETYYSGPAGNWCTAPNGKGNCTNSISDKDNLIIDSEIDLRGSIELKGDIEILKTGKLNVKPGDLEIGGKLTIKSGGVLSVQRNLLFKNKSLVVVESKSFIIAGNDFINANNSNNIVLNGSLEVGNNFENGNNAVIKGSGDISVSGNCINKGIVFNVKNTCNGINNLALPVELLSFDATVKDNSVHLDWATASEKDFDFFTVERSSDAAEFTPIGNSIKGKGNSSTISNYNYIDDSPFSGRSYYRLKATDFDGTVEYHPAISVNFQSESSFKVYPNPSEGSSLNVLVNSPSDSRSSLSIYNIIGDEVFKSSLRNGRNEFKFDIPLEAGLYVVIVDNGILQKQTKITVE